ncbi:MAG: type I polyketide synthase [Symploca sp. SIO1B1]|nr:type I polyketide synthase [Symploca sp. SIO1B1]
MSNNQVQDYAKLMKMASDKIAKLEAELDAVTGKNKSEPIAIIGMSCRFPGGASTSEAFWDILQNGVDAITEVPKDRWHLDDYYNPDPDTPGKIYTRYGGFIDEIQEFDANFFGISPKETIHLDPQQRLLLEVSWEALEKSGKSPQKLKGSQTGVFIGIGARDYVQRILNQGLEKFDAYVSTGNAASTASGRISYLLGLIGPNLAVDTACSSSLVSIHLACSSLRNQECNLALAGGVNLLMSPETSIAFSKARMLSFDGRCKTFDISADGFVRGEGCGIVVLKRLSDAVADQDNILAVIRGSAINQDGDTSGLTVPNSLSQQSVIRQALANGEVDPASVSYIEAHGTGTSLGDPIEVESIGTIFGKTHSLEQPLIIGSVKTNIGHTEAASGIAGFMKLVLQLQHQQIAPSLHFKQPNPYINWSQLPLKVPTQLTPWQTNGKSRIAGVSSFGFSGTNAHIILEEAPREGNRQQAKSNSKNYLERSIHVLTLSGKTQTALVDLVRSYQNYLKTNPELRLADICYTANTGRAQFHHKLAVVASNQQELVEKLRQHQQGGEVAGIFSGEISSKASAAKIAFLFTGQGSQYVNMGRQLYQQAPAFREAINQCEDILSSVEAFKEKSLREILYPADDSSDSSLLNQTAYTQPALFAIEYALFKLWQSWGIKPDVVMGHSVGEYVAATVAGVFSLQDGLKLIATRGRLMQQLPSGGEMVSVMVKKSKVIETLKAMSLAEKVAIAAINGPQSIVISGEGEAVRAIATHLESAGIKAKQLQVSHAFHSPLMEPMLAEFEALASQLTYHQPRIPIISNVTGTKADQSIASAQYWINHVRQPVKFAQGMAALHQQGYETFLEIGAKPILLGMGRQCLPEDTAIWLPSLRPGVDEWQQMLSSLGQLYVQGAKVDWLEFNRDDSHQKVVLPTYPFQREKYWVQIAEEKDAKAILSAKLHPLINQKFQSPLAKEIFFESSFSAKNLPFLADHIIYEHLVAPGASHISLLLAAASLSLPKTECQLEDIMFPQALAIEKEGERMVQVALTPQDNSYSFQVISFEKSLESQKQEVYNNGTQVKDWAVHATGKLTTVHTDQPIISVEKIQARCPQQIDNTEIYQYLEERQIKLGESFRWIDRIWLGEGEVLCQMKIPQTVRDATKYQLHPGLIDSCFQSCGVLNLTSNRKETFVPFRVKKFIFYDRPHNGLLWCYTRSSEEKQSKDKFITEIQLCDEHGQLVAHIVGLEARKANRQMFLMTLGADLSNWFYQIDWQPQPLKAATPLPTQTNKWLILSEDSQLIATLENQGYECIRVSAADSYEQLTPKHYQINPIVREQFQQLLEENPGITKVVHLWSLQSQESKYNLELEKIQETNCAVALHLVQAIINSKLEASPQLWLVTQGTQSVNSDKEVINPEYGSLWALGRVIAQEHPELRCKRLDYDPNLDPTQIADSLVAEFLSEDIEDQIALRQGSRYVARLVQTPKLNPITSVAQPVQLKLSNYGVIDNLQWQPLQRKTPKANEVEIEVKAVGLNFRDVLNALGLLKEYYDEHLGISSAEQLTFGLEGVGRISAVGEQVSQWQVGDEVIATMVHDGFSSFITAPVESLVAKPKQMSFSEAATLPLTFLTAYYGLQHLAKIQPGERVLIHAAAGGVGQAAVQIAQLTGAEIFATASPSKWEFLKSLGIKHIMNSRTLDFADQIMKLTAGGGVDVVLNSLNGEYIPKCLEVLAPQGRFVEIGKIGIWEQQQVQEKRPDVSYFPFDIGEVAQQQPQIMAQLSEVLSQKWNQGKFVALPHKVFPSTEVTAAFRYMQQAQQIGKIVVEMPQTLGELKFIQPEASYLITGGLGALGLEVARWTVAQGAKHLVLNGRSAPKETAQKIIEELETAGASVSVLLGDISIEEDVAQIFQQIQTSLPPLKGVIHAAGVLDDGLLQNLSWQQFTKVMAPKVAGTWHLHQLTKDLPLDFFVCFSSIASLLGNPGQGNYATANGFMDALAKYRRGMGLPGLSINWGAWASAGMAARLASGHQQRVEASGMSAIELERGMQALGLLLSNSPSQVGVLPINWSKFLSQFPNGERIPFLEAVISAEPSFTQKSAFREQLEAVAVTERQELLTTHLRSIIAKTLGLQDIQKIRMRQSLFDLGLDSLMAVDLKNRLESSLETSLSSTLLFDYPTVETLVEYLVNNVIEIDFSCDLDEAQKKVEKGNYAGEQSSQLSDVTELSETELEASVLQEIAALEKLI